MRKKKLGQGAKSTEEEALTGKGVNGLYKKVNFTLPKRIPKPLKNSFIESAIEMIPILNVNLDKTDDTELLNMAQALEPMVTFQKNDGKHVRETIKNLQELSRILLKRNESDAVKYEKWVKEAILPFLKINLLTGEFEINPFLPVSANAFCEFFRTKRTWQIIKALPLFGMFYIGECVRCKRMFPKKRSDEKYDRGTCRREATRGNTKN